MFEHRGLDMLLITVVGGGLIAFVPLVVIALYWLYRKRRTRKMPQGRDDPS